MKELKLSRGWNADGFKLENLRRLLQNNGFDLVNGYVVAKIDENWDWVFSNPPKEQPKYEEDQEKSIHFIPDIKKESEDWALRDALPIDETGYKGLNQEKPKKTTPICKKCGTYHWPMHKCPAKKEK